MLRAVMLQMKLVTNCVIKDGDRLLMLKKPRRGWWVAPGGKVEPGESLTEAVVREIAEETGLRIEQPTLRGVFTIILQEAEQLVDHWMLFTFYTEKFQGDVLKETEEGELEWVPIAELATRPMAAGDREFLSLFANTDRQLHGKFVYTPDYQLLYFQPE
jgi:8-oxo-dGTP diphosphatase